jgi:membrane-associated phospholipid phosphatase
MKKYFYIIIFLLIFCVNSFAQNNYYPNKNYFKSYWVDSKSIAKSTFLPSKKTILIGSAFIAAEWICYNNDAQIHSIFNHNQNNFNKNLAFGLEKFGNGTYVYPAIAALYLSGLILKNQDCQYIGLQTTKAFVLGGILMEILKVGVGRARPFQSENPYDFKHFSKEENYTSFPSGHTFHAFTVATILSQQFHKPLITAASYAIAAGVGLSRIYDNKHWMSDVLVGGAIGYCISKVIMKSGNFPFEKQKKSAEISLVKF